MPQNEATIRPRGAPAPATDSSRSNCVHTTVYFNYQKETLRSAHMQNVMQ